LVCLHPAAVRAQGAAAKQFEQGNELFQKGQYAEAIKAYTEAHRLAPHPSALFNIARCHENLGDHINALFYFKQALERTTEATGRADIQRRIQRLQTRPVKIFVSTQPSGAAVTVDGHEAPEEARTPTVVLLTPGEHVLILDLDGHHRAVRRVKVEMGKEQPVEVPLEPRGKPCPTPRPPCPKFKICPSLKLANVEDLHLQISLLGVFGLTSNRPMAAGPGIQVYLTYKNVYVGSHFIYFPVGQESINPIKIPTSKDNIEATRVDLSWLLLQVEAGYVFDFNSWYTYVTGGLGVSSDQVEYSGEGKTNPGDILIRDSFTTSELSFAWSVGAGIEAMATEWLSFGAAARFGMFHGNRADKDDIQNLEDENNFPYGLIWGSMIFHL